MNYTFVTKDGFRMKKNTPGARYHILLCSDGSERTYEMKCVRLLDGSKAYEYHEKCESKPVLLLDDPLALKKERDELKAALVSAQRLIDNSAPYSMGDVSGMKARHDRDMFEANARIIWLERELKLEKAKNARKRGL